MKSVVSPAQAGLAPVRRHASMLFAFAFTLGSLAACGGSDGGRSTSADASSQGTTDTSKSAQSVATATPTSVQDAARLADQASFGAIEALIETIRAQGAVSWVSSQMSLSLSHYTSGKGDAIHKNTSSIDFCSMPANASATCWRDWFSSTPQVWDFYRNAVTQGDQLRQRVAFALSQIVVVSDLDVGGTYGYRSYHNTLLANAFGNYRQVLKMTAASPLMGDYLNNANNDKTAPNENFAREFLQLMSIGTCQLEQDGSLTGGACKSTYDNAMVRNYAFALTGWTYPAGGSSTTGCRTGTNCVYYGGSMVPAPALHDTNEHPLLTGMKVPRGSDAPGAMSLVLDSVMLHPNTAPFIGRQLIQHLVSSNPSPAYVRRVAAAFTSGTFTAQGSTFGTGQRGDLSATVAAVLLDAEARTVNPGADAGRLREPVLMFTGVLRALNGRTDGDALGGWWGASLKQHVFRAPSIFSFYPPDYPVAGTSLTGPSFGIHSAHAAVERLNFLTYLIYWGGSAPDPAVPNALGTKINLQPFEVDADDPAKLVDRFSVLATGALLPTAARSEVVNAVAAYTSLNNANWKAERVKQAAYLVFGSPQYQVQH